MYLPKIVKFGRLSVSPKDSWPYPSASPKDSPYLSHPSGA